MAQTYGFVPAVVAGLCWLTLVELFGLATASTVASTRYNLSEWLHSTTERTIEGGRDELVDASTYPTEYNSSHSLDLQGVTVTNVAFAGQLPNCTRISQALLRKLTDSPQLPSTADFLKLSWLVSNSLEVVQLSNVLLVTDCPTLAAYQCYLCAGSFGNGQLVNSTHLFIRNWTSARVIAHNVTMTCPYNTTAFDTINATRNTCIYAKATTAQRLHDIMLQSSTYYQVVALVSGVIVLNDEGIWASSQPRVNISYILVLQGNTKYGANAVIDFRFRTGVWYLWPTGMVVFCNMTLTGLPNGKGILTMPVDLTSWSVTGPNYVEQPRMFLGVFQFYSTRMTACDNLDYIYTWIDMAMSPTPSVRQQAMWVTPVAQNMSVNNLGHNSMFVERSSGVKGLMVQSWINCSDCDEAPREYCYSGSMDISQNAAIPLTQLFGVANASDLVAHIVYAQNLRMDPNVYSLMLFNNISFGDPDVVPPNGTWPLVITRACVWARFHVRHVTLDFNWRPDLFTITPGVTIELRNLTLLNLPSLAGLAAHHPAAGPAAVPGSGGPAAGVLWCCALWPFVFPRNAPSRLRLLEVTLQLPQDELDFLATLLLREDDCSSVSVHTSRKHKTAATASGTNGSHALSDWSVSPGQVGSLQGNWNGWAKQGGHMLFWQFATLDGFGYETLGVSLRPSTSASMPPNYNVTTYADFASAYSWLLSGQGSLYDPTDGAVDDSSSSSSYVGIVVGTTLGVVALLVVASTTFLVWRRLQGGAGLGLGRMRSTGTESSTLVKIEVEGTLAGLCATTVTQCEVASEATQHDGGGSMRGLSGLGADIFSQVSRLHDQVVDNQLVMMTHLGSGATSEVFQGTWRHLPVAIKVVPLDRDTPRHSVAQEIGIMHSITHNNVVAIYGYQILDSRTLRRLANLHFSSTTNAMHSEALQPEAALLTSDASAAPADADLSEPHNNNSNHNSGVATPERSSRLNRRGGRAPAASPAAALSVRNHTEGEPDKAAAQLLPQQRASSVTHARGGSGSTSLALVSGFQSLWLEGSPGARHQPLGMTVMPATAHALRSLAKKSTQCVLIVEELSDGGSLGAAVDRGMMREGATGKTKMQLVYKIAIDVVTAMVHLHSKGIIHGDLTPSNVMLKVCQPVPSRLFLQDQADDFSQGTASCMWRKSVMLSEGSQPGGKDNGHSDDHDVDDTDDDGGGGGGDGGGGGGGDERRAGSAAHDSDADKEEDQVLVAKVMDFGLSHVLRCTQTHVSGILGGTMYYTAPEVMLQGQLSPAADVFSFGVLLWELFHGTPPWRRTRMAPVINAATLLQYSADCPPDLERLCRACTAEDPSRRPPFVLVKSGLEQLRPQEGRR